MVCFLIGGLFTSNDDVRLKTLIQNRIWLLVVLLICVVIQGGKVWRGKLLLAELLSEPLAKFIIVKSHQAANTVEESAYDEGCYMLHFSLVEHHGDGESGNLKDTNTIEKLSARINAVTN